MGRSRCTARTRRSHHSSTRGSVDWFCWEATDNHRLARMVRCVRGEMSFEVEVAPGSTTAAARTARDHRNGAVFTTDALTLMQRPRPGEAGRAPGPDGWIAHGSGGSEAAMGETRIGACAVPNECLRGRRTRGERSPARWARARQPRFGQIVGFRDRGLGRAACVGTELLGNGTKHHEVHAALHRPRLPYVTHRSPCGPQARWPRRWAALRPRKARDRPPWPERPHLPAMSQRAVVPGEDRRNRPAA